MESVIESAIPTPTKSQVRKTAPLLRGPISAETPLSCLGLPAPTVEALRNDGYKFVEDITLLSAKDLTDKFGAESACVSKLVRALSRCNMTLRVDSAHALISISARARTEMRNAVRTGATTVKVDLSQSVARLGLRVPYLETLVHHGITILNQVVSMKTRDIQSILGSAGARAVHDALKVCGLEFADKPDAYTLWYYGLYSKEETKWDLSGASPVKYLAPHIGLYSVSLLEKANITTIEQLLAAITGGALSKISLMSKTKAARISAVLSKTGFLPAATA